MTAEIVIMNREAIALASDSAVTMTSISGEKIFTSANKLFTLSKYHPVGIMIYGSAVFMDIPWETIIKIYRNKLGRNHRDTLKDYANDFINFLDNGNTLFPDSIQEEYVINCIYSYFGFVKARIKDEVRLIISEKGEVSDQEIEQIVSTIIENDYKKWEESENIPSISKSFNKQILTKYRNIINNAINDSFEKTPLSMACLNQLKKIIGWLFSRFPEGIEKRDMSGIVIAGFGENDTFPALVSFHIEGIVNNKLKYKEYISDKVGFEQTASIIPFAQREMVDVFIGGMDPFYIDLVDSYLARLLDGYAVKIIESLKGYNDNEKEELENGIKADGQKILEDIRKILEDEKRKRYVNPVISVVSMLPKDELALMAESLVNLTCLRRKFTTDRETVGGPIDVAVISKGDGFVWIKRKHYFKQELNPQFFANYYKETSDEQS